MANHYDPYGRRPRPANRSTAGRSPTMADYQQLAQAYQELQAQQQESQLHRQKLQEQLETQAAELKDVQTELAIKDEALHKQSADFREMESELVWTRAAVEQLQAKLDETEDETWREKYTRLQAEMENMRRRLDQRADQRITQAKHDILLDMVPLADHLDMAMAHAGALDDSAAKEFAANIKATLHAFLETLRRYGVERISPMGEPFDPNFHEAVGQVVDEQTPPDHVAQVLQAGYRDGERVIRPARVLVSRGGAGQDAELVDVGRDADANGGGNGI